MQTYRRDKAILATLKSYLIDAQFRSEYEDFIAPEKLEAAHFHENSELPALIELAVAYERNYQGRRSWLTCEGNKASVDLLNRC